MQNFSSYLTHSLLFKAKKQTNEEWVRLSEFQGFFFSSLSDDVLHDMD